MEIVNILDDIDPNATISFEADGEELSTIYENKSIRIEGLNPQSRYHISVTITGDENYNDITAPYISKAKTKDVPTEGWGTYADTSWYNDTDTEFILNTAEQLAGLATLVNKGNSFEGKKVKLGADIDLSKYVWIPIGWPESVPFKGVLDGQNHKITGALSESYGSEIGLFGCVAGSKAVVSNLLVDDSYFLGSESVGGIVGYLYDGSIVDNCVSYAVVNAVTHWGSKKSIGGIVGRNGSNACVQNCFFYGRVEGYDWVGGIAGDSTSKSWIKNCANYGVVIGGSDRAAGGIVGTVRNTPFVYNCYNVGTVKSVGGDCATGAIVGWAKEKAYAEVYACYYLEGSASSGRAVANPNEGGLYVNNTASFSGTGDTYVDGTGKKLVEILNEWSHSNMNYDGWEVKDDKSYPTLKDSPIR